MALVELRRTRKAIKKRERERNKRARAKAKDGMIIVAAVVVDVLNMLITQI